MRTARLTCGTRRSYQSMSHITSNANSATQTWQKSTQSLTSNSKDQGSTQQTTKYAQPVDNFAQSFNSRSRHADSLWKLDRDDMLFGKSPSGAHRKRFKRVACGVAIALVGSLCLPMSHASSGSIDDIQPKHYIRLLLDDKQALCLIKLYGKESAFNPYAIGNLSGKYHTYGIPQLKNALIADKSAIEQIHYGLKYINHRYQGDTCKAWMHWVKKGWH